MSPRMSPFDIAEIGAMDFGTLRQVFLRQVLRSRKVFTTNPNRTRMSLDNRLAIASTLS